MRVAAAERGESSDDILDQSQQATKRPAIKLSLTKRVRYWSSGTIVGSKEFVRNLTDRLISPERAANKRFGQAQGPDGVPVFAYRRYNKPVADSAEE